MSQRTSSKRMHLLINDLPNRYQNHSSFFTGSNVICMESNILSMTENQEPELNVTSEAESGVFRPPSATMLLSFSSY